MDPRVSVIIPAYNAAIYIARALSSLDNQTRKPDEVIVIDDGSEDDTSKRVEEFSWKSDLKVVFKRQTNKGLPTTRNVGIKISTGNLIAFLDSDDMLYPDFLKLAISGLTHHKHWIACFSDLDVVDKTGKLIAKDSDNPIFRTIEKKDLGDGFFELSDNMLFSKIVSGNVIPMTMLIRKSEVEAVSGFDEDLRFSEDRLFILKLIKRGGKFGYIKKPLGIWQRHNMNQTSESNTLKRCLYSDLALKKLLEGKEGLNLTLQELTHIKATQKALATEWVYTASASHSITTFALASRLLLQRRITATCFTKAIARYFTPFLREHDHRI